MLARRGLAPTGAFAQPNPPTIAIPSGPFRDFRAAITVRVIVIAAVLVAAGFQLHGDIAPPAHGAAIEAHA